MLQAPTISYISQLFINIDSKLIVHCFDNSYEFVNLPTRLNSGIILLQFLPRDATQSRAQLCHSLLSSCQSVRSSLSLPKVFKYAVYPMLSRYIIFIIISWDDSARYLKTLDSPWIRRSRSLTLVSLPIESAYRSRTRPMLVSHSNLFFDPIISYVATFLRYCSFYASRWLHPIPP